MILDSNIYISREAIWLLHQLVKSHNSKLGQQETPLTTGGLANDLIIQHVRQSHPKLMELWQRRRELDEQAMEILK